MEKAEGGGEPAAESEEMQRERKSALACTLWLEKGVFDALEKQYLTRLIFRIEGKDECCEMYVWRFSYPTADTCSVSVAEQTSKTKQHTIEDICGSAVSVVKMLTAMCDVLPPLPQERELKLYCVFNEEITPPDYQPEHFIEADTEDDLVMGNLPKMYRIKCGKIATAHHSCAIQVHSTFANCEGSNSFEENLARAVERQDVAEQEQQQQQQQQQQLQHERTSTSGSGSTSSAEEGERTASDDEGDVHAAGEIRSGGRVYAHGAAAASAAAEARAPSRCAPRVLPAARPAPGRKRVHERIAPDAIASQESEAIFDLEGESTQDSVFTEGGGGGGGGRGGGARRYSVVARPIRQYRKRRRTHP